VAGIWIKAGCDPDEIHLIEIPLVWLADGFVNGYDSSRFTNEEYRKWLKGLPETRWDDLNGRPTGDVRRVAATLACYFYDTWRTENCKHGIQDYGHRGEMKDDAAKYVVEDFFAWRFGDGVRTVFLWELGQAKDVESLILLVRDLMDKPKKRRDPGIGGEIGFLGSRHGLVPRLPPKLSRKR
jgi:hypothetical protein